LLSVLWLKQKGSAGTVDCSEIAWQTSRGDGGGLCGYPFLEERPLHNL